MMIKIIKKIHRRILYALRRFLLSRKDGVFLSKHVYICSNVKVIIEKDAVLTIGHNVRLEHDTVLYCKKGSRVSIGNYSSTGHHTEISCNNSIEVGDNVIFSAFTYVADANHRYDLQGVPIQNQGMSVGEVKIGSNVWLGRGAMVLKDAVVGNNSIVGANSVVTKKFNDNSILGGVPAKLLKQINS